MKQYIYTAKDKRQRVVIVDDNNHVTSKSYPRMLMEEKLGRPLQPNEDVHHKDGNTLNNDLDNQEIIEHGLHQQMHNPPKYQDTVQRCQICNKEFIYTAKQMCRYQGDLRIGRHRAITCSKHCAYLFGIQEQVKRDFDAECELNGETSPNGNTVPNE